MSKLSRAILPAVLAVALSGCAGGPISSRLTEPGVIADAEHALEIARANNDPILEGCLSQVVEGAKFLERSAMGAQGPFTSLAVARTIRRAADVDVCVALARGPVSRFLGGF